MTFASASQFHVYLNQEKALVGAFTVIVQLHRLIVYAALHITDNSVHNGRWRPGPGVGAEESRCSSQLWVQAAAAVSGPRQPGVTVPEWAVSTASMCPASNGRNSELKFNYWCWSKLVSDLLIVFPNPIL